MKSLFGELFNSCKNIVISLFQDSENHRTEWNPDKKAEDYLSRIDKLLEVEKNHLKNSSIITMVEMLMKESKPLFKLINGIFGEAGGLLENVEPLIKEVLKKRESDRAGYRKFKAKIEDSKNYLYHLYNDLKDYSLSRIDESVKKDYERMKIQHGAIGQELKQKDEVIDELKEQIEEMEKNAQAEKGGLSKEQKEQLLRSHQSFVQNFLSKTKEMATKHKDAVEALNNQVKILGAEVEKKEDKIVELENKNRDLIEEFKKKLEKAVREAKRVARKQPDTNLERIAELEDEVDELKTALNDSKGSLDQKKDLIENLKSQAKRLEEEIKELRDRILISVEEVKKKNKELRADPRYKDPNCQPLIEWICDLNAKLKRYQLEKEDISQQWKEISAFKKKFKQISDAKKLNGSRTASRIQDPAPVGRSTMFLNKSKDKIFEEDAAKNANPKKKEVAADEEKPAQKKAKAKKKVVRGLRDMKKKRRKMSTMSENTSTISLDGDNNEKYDDVSISSLDDEDTDGSSGPKNAKGKRAGGKKGAKRGQKTQKNDDFGDDAAISLSTRVGDLAPSETTQSPTKEQVKQDAYRNSKLQEKNEKIYKLQIELDKANEELRCRKRDAWNDKEKFEKDIASLNALLKERDLTIKNLPQIVLENEQKKREGVFKSNMSRYELLVPEEGCTTCKDYHFFVKYLQGDRNRRFKKVQVDAFNRGYKKGFVKCADRFKLDISYLRLKDFKTQ